MDTFIIYIIFEKMVLQLTLVKTKCSLQIKEALGKEKSYMIDPSLLSSPKRDPKESLQTYKENLEEFLVLLIKVKHKLMTTVSAVKYCIIFDKKASLSLDMYDIVCN